MQRQAVHPAADQGIVTGKQERRRNAELAGDGEGAPLAGEQMARQTETPPRHFVDSAQHRLDFPGRGGKAPPFNGRKEVTLEHHARSPALRNVVWQAHHSAATARSSPLIQCSRSASARCVVARFFASTFSVPRRRAPPSPLSAWASGGKRPKLTFMGWYARVSADCAPDVLSMCPPVICASKAPCAVVAGGGVRHRPNRSAAAKRPARSPMAADST